MFKRTFLALVFIASAVLPLAAHHGWSSFDASKPVTIEGKIATSKFENPHVTLTVEMAGAAWTLMLAPTSRMLNRGATAELVAAGKTISAYGYPSKTEAKVMRAERITVDGKTIEMR